MKMHRCLAVAAISTLLSACTLQGGIEQSALDYNRAADRVDKELLLLNIARAARGEHMTFTGIAEMRGSFLVKVAGSANIPFGGDANSVFTFTPSTTYQTSPSTKIVPLATAAFQKGIVNGVTPEILLMLWERGWPKELLLYLMIEKVVMKVPRKTPNAAEAAEKGKPCLRLTEPEDPDKDPEFKNEWAKIKNEWAKSRLSTGPEWVEVSEKNFSHTCEFVNEPDDPDEFRDFREFLGWAELMPYSAHTEGDQAGPSVKEDEIYRLRYITEAHDGDLKLKPSTKNGKKTGEFHLESEGESRVEFAISETLSPNVTAKNVKFNIGTVSTSFGPKGERPTHSLSAMDKDKAKDKPKVQVRIHLRSPQGMIFYLGLIVRESGKKREEKVEYQKIYKNENDCDPKKRSMNPKERLKKRSLNNEADDKVHQDNVKALRKSGCIVPIFVGWIGEGDAEVAVDLRGDRYFVPSGREPPKNEFIAGRSLMAMALVRSLFNMHTSREDLPTTQTVITSGPTL